MEINANLLLEELRVREILTGKNVSDIKNYICLHYPKHSQQLRAKIFADAVNKIINKNISSISITYRDEITKTLLREAVKKYPFAINANDVYQACLNTDFKDDSFIDEVSQWCGKILEKPYIKETIKDFTLKFINRSEAPLTVNATVNNSVNDAKSEASIHDDAIESMAENIPEPTDEVTEAGETVEIVGEIPFSDKDTIEHNDIPDTHEIDRVKCILYIKNILSPKRILIAASVLTLVIASSYIISALRPAKINDSIQTSNQETDPSSPTNSIFANLDNQDDFYLENIVLSGLGYSVGLHENIPKHKEMLYMTATAYDLSYESCGKTREHPAYGITYTGTRVKLGRTVAVDPSVIPLGSEMYIIFPEEYSNLNGVYIAEDTGSLIKGNKIDIFFGEDNPGESIVNESAMGFGVRKVYVYILN